MSLDFKPFMKQKQQEQADKMNIDRLNDQQFMKTCVDLSKQLDLKEHGDQ